MLVVCTQPTPLASWDRTTACSSAGQAVAQVETVGVGDARGGEQRERDPERVAHRPVAARERERLEVTDPGRLRRRRARGASSSPPHTERSQP